MIFNRDGAPVSEAALRSMTNAMNYRGPDGINHAIRANIGLGQCHMKTTPESFSETLPLSNESGDLILILAGRADNNAVLRSELLGKGAILRNRSDAELFLRAYEVWGRDCIQHIDGDFAFAIWDARKRFLFCARDRIGSKPFFYWFDDKSLVVASDIHAMIGVLDRRPPPNIGMVAQYLATTFHTLDETLWSGVRRLLPAHIMEVYPDRVTIDRYWTPDVDAAIRGEECELVERYQSLLKESVAAAARTIGPVGCAVSGGLDSSAIFAVAHRLAENGELCAEDLLGFTLDFDYETRANELKYAMAVGDFLGRHVTRVKPSYFPLAWHREWIRQYLDFPSGPNGTMSLDLRRAAREAGCRVLLVGVGGDEWLGGSLYAYAEELGSARFDELWRLLKADSASVGWINSIVRLLRYGVYPYAPEGVRAAVRQMILPEGFDRSAWLSPQLKKSLRERGGLKSEKRSYGRLGHLGQLLTLNTGPGLLAHEAQERQAASVGIELRRPLYTASMVQFSFSVPERMRLRGNVDKLLHRRAMIGHLPEIVRNRLDKAEFSEVLNWHMDELVDWFADGAHLAPFVDTNITRDLFRKRDNEIMGSWPQYMIWTLFSIKSLYDAILLKN